MSNRLKLEIGCIKNIVIRTITTNIFFISRRIIRKDTTRRNPTDKVIVIRNVTITISAARV